MMQAVSLSLQLLAQSQPTLCQSLAALPSQPCSSVNNLEGLFQTSPSSVSSSSKANLTCSRHLDGKGTSQKEPECDLGGPHMV